MRPTVLSFIAERSSEDADALVRPGGLRLSYGALGMATAAVQQAIEARVGDIRGLIVGIQVGDAAGFVATLLAVLEAGGVALPVEDEAEAAQARAVALVVGDAADDRLDVLPGDASRRSLPPEAALVLRAGGRRAVIAAPAVAAAVDAIVAAEGMTTRTRTRLVAPLGSTAVLVGDVLATLRAGGMLVDAGVPGQLRPRGLDLPEGLRLGRFGDDGVVRALDGVTLTVEAGGALWAAAPWAMMGYLDDDAATRAALETRDGVRWLRAGHVLEQALAATPGVREAAVLAVADPRGGVRVYAFADGDASAAPPWAGKRVTLESLPHAADGSIDRQALRRMVSAD
jgi:acyl-CoA synthetase (AMP-forming)/AMP-acid ligase II